jgi:hypothetical protein
MLVDQFRSTEEICDHEGCFIHLFPFISAILTRLQSVTMHLVLRLRGGGWEPGPKYEMSMAAGGYIRQKIIADTYEPEIWDVDRTTMFNVQILNSASFQRVTGLSLPPTPIDAAAYAKLKLPYFRELEEPPPVNVQPNTVWRGVKSVSQIDGPDEPSYEGMPIMLDPEDPIRVFSPFVVLMAEVHALEQREREYYENQPGDFVSRDYVSQRRKGSRCQVI